MTDSRPAFPCDRIISDTVGGGQVVVSHAGMELRDYFAAKALQGMLAENGGAALTNDTLAEVSYHLADAMMEARAK